MIAIGLWKLAFGDCKRLLVPEMLSANTPWCMILNKLNKIEIANAKFRQYLPPWQSYQPRGWPQT